MTVARCARRCRRPTSSASSRPDDGHTITAFREKPKDAVGLPDAPDQVFASMGSYMFTTEALIESVCRDAEASGSSHDMGGNIVPMLVERCRPRVRLLAQRRPGRASATTATGATSGRSMRSSTPTWTCLGRPIFNLYNVEWPILSYHAPLPPAKFVFDEDERRGEALDSMVCAGW